MTLTNDSSVLLNLIPTTTFHHFQSAYDAFLVDIIDDAGNLTRGCVCDVTDGFLSVQTNVWDKTATLVPFNRLMLGSSGEFRRQPAWSTSSRAPTEALISRGPGQPSQWQRVRLLHETRFKSTAMRPDWWLMLVQIAEEGPRYLISEDLADPGNQRFRYCRRRRPDVTRGTFQKTSIPLPERAVAVVRECLYSRGFRIYWSYDTQSKIVGVVESSLILISRGPLSENAQERIDDLLKLSGEKLEALHWVKPFLLATSSYNVELLLNELVVFITTEGLPDCTMAKFCDMPSLIRTEVFSNLDYYGRQYLQRVSTNWQVDLQCPFLRTTVIIPYRHWGESAHHLTHRIQMSVTRCAKTIFLTGMWYDFLEPLAALFSCLSIHLRWLVMVDSDGRNTNDFLKGDGKQMTRTLSQICRNFAFKRYSCERSLYDFLGASRIKYDHRMRISIFVPSFTYYISNESICDVQLALFNHLDDIVQPLDKSRLTQIQACIAVLNEIFDKPGDWIPCYWTTFAACFTKWRVQPPRTLEDAARYPFEKLSRRNLVSKTLSMWANAIENQLTSSHLKEHL